MGKAAACWLRSLANNAGPVAGCASETGSRRSEAGHGSHARSCALDKISVEALQPHVGVVHAPSASNVLVADKHGLHTTSSPRDAFLMDRLIIIIINLVTRRRRPAGRAPARLIRSSTSSAQRSLQRQTRRCPRPPVSFVNVPASRGVMSFLQRHLWDDNSSWRMEAVPQELLASGGCLICRPMRHHFVASQSPKHPVLLAF